MARRAKDEGPSGSEAYRMVAGEMYVPGETGYVPPDEVIADLDEEIVHRARAYADDEYLRWPPDPVCDVPMLHWMGEL